MATQPARSARAADDLHVVVLAAGKSTRMKSARPKVLHEIAGQSIIARVLRTAGALPVSSTTVVVGHGGDEVRKAVAAARADVSFAVQSPQLGTGHALLQTEPLLAGTPGTLLLLYGDVPMLSAATLSRLVDAHRASRAAATVLTTTLPDPTGYGRIVRDAAGRVARIVEERDASAAERGLAEVNSGIYAFALEGLFEALHGLAADNAQGEYYLTDLIGGFARAGRPIASLAVADPDELRGINSRIDLAEVAALVRARKNRALMLAGVTLDDPASTFVDDDVAVGADTRIGPGVHLEGRTSIGSACRLHAGVRLTNATVADRVTILDHTIVVDSAIDAEASVGPFAHIRPASHIGARARVGNFVELKKTRLGAGSKANHLAYLGDATIGDEVNVGAGTITCNYDGERKHPTTVDDGVFIGSDSQLVAPVHIGKGAYVAAGSTVTRDVPPGALAVSRGRQVNKEHWVKRRKERV